jgi:hypothetical protein
MTHIVSFGTVHVIAAFPESRCRNFIHVCLVMVVRMKKNTNKKRKSHQWPKRRILRRLGPFTSSPPSLSYGVTILYMYELEIVVRMKKNRNKKKNHHWPKRHILRRLGPFTSSPPSQSHPRVTVSQFYTCTT